MLRGMLVWFLIMLAETVHGVLRGLLLVPRLGEEDAARIGWPVGAALVIAISTFAIGWTGLRDRGRLLLLGGVWALLTLAFEAAVGHLRGLSAPEILAAAHPLSGSMLYSAAVMLFAPLLAARLRRIR